MQNELRVMLALASAGVLAGAVACSDDDDNTPVPVPVVDAGPDSGNGDLTDAGGADSSTEPPGPTTIAGVVTQTVLVATANDPNLVNAWGLAFTQAGDAAWIADNGTGNISVYDANKSLANTIAVPVPDGIDQAASSGLVANSLQDNFDGDAFIGVTEEGTVIGFPADGSDPVIRIDHSGDGAVYKGVAIATSGGQPVLLVTNFNAGTVDVFDTNYTQTNMLGDLTDATLPAGFAPFNVATFGAAIVVTYAKQDDQKHDDVKGEGNGFINAFDLNGTMAARLASNGTLNSPWGLAMVPNDAAAVQGRLLVGNFGDGKINVFTAALTDSANMSTTFEGVLGDSNNNPLSIDGLWSLQFPPNAGTFDSKMLYFTAGPSGEQAGAYGSIEIMSQP
jgi:uncharacterized protein (TIGR03118 family)